MTRRATAKTVDELLTQAWAALPRRPSPVEALHAPAWPRRPCSNSV